jgi:hypothetical protein
MPDLLDQIAGAPKASPAALPASQPSGDLLDQIASQSAKPAAAALQSPGAVETFGEHAATGIGPGAAFALAAPKGAKIGAKIGAATGEILGLGPEDPAADVAAGVLGATGAFIGGLVSGGIASWGAYKAQHATLKSISPKFTDEMDKRLAAGADAHPFTAVAGDVAGNIPTMELSLPKLSQLPFRAALGGSIGAAQPLLQGRKPTAQDIASGAASAALLGGSRFEPKPSTTGAPNATSGIPSATRLPQPEVRPPMGQSPPLRQQGQAAETRQAEQSGAQGNAPSHVNDPRQQASGVLSPHELHPALLVNGELVVGDDTHTDHASLIPKLSDKAFDAYSDNNFRKDAAHVFVRVDANGNVIGDPMNREQAAKAIGFVNSNLKPREAPYLNSEDLRVRKDATLKPGADKAQVLQDLKKLDPAVLRSRPGLVTLMRKLQAESDSLKNSSGWSGSRKPSPAELQPTDIDKDAANKAFGEKSKTGTLADIKSGKIKDTSGAMGALINHLRSAIDKIAVIKEWADFQKQSDEKTAELTADSENNPSKRAEFLQHGLVAQLPREAIRNIAMFGSREFSPEVVDAAKKALATTKPPEVSSKLVAEPEPQLESSTPLDPQTGNPIPQTAGMGGARLGEVAAKGDASVTGLAARVRAQRETSGHAAPTQPGKGIAPEASVERGQQLLDAGADPEKVMSEFEKTNRASSDDFAVVRAHQDFLARATNGAEEQFGTDSPEFRAANKTEADWSARTKAMQTEWAKSGHAQQGEVDIDTGTFSGLKRAYRDAHDGEEMPKKDEKRAKELADENAKNKKDQADLLKKVGDAIDRETGSKPGGKIPTADETRAALADYKGGKMTTAHVRALWNYAKKNYIDKGNADFRDIVQKVSTDLGIPFKDVAKGLAQPKTVRKLTDALWRKQTDARRVSESAKRWVRQTNSAILGQAVPRLARLMFGAKVFGHGGVAFGTHAPMVAFMPKYSKTYFRDFGKMYKMVFSPAEYEMNVQALRSDPNFATAGRAGLVNDPYKVEDFNNPDMAEILGPNQGKIRKFFGNLAGGGNRGYFALKILRQDMFNQGWNKLPESIKTPEMAKAMADDINHITGVVKSGAGGNKAALALFAPRLLMSRAAFLAGDPYKAIEIASTAASPAKWKALPPEQKFMVLNQVKQKATILATAYGLLKVNQAILSATGSNQKINFTDPTKSDFMKFKVAGMDFSFGNAMLNMARLPVRLWTIGAGDGGKLKHVIYPDESMYSAAGEFARSQASPITSMGLDFVFKGDYENRPLPKIPGYGKPIPMPKRLAAEGIKPYTWPEFFAEQFSPIPLEEGQKDVWRNGFHLTEDGMKTLAKAAGTTIVMMGTGGRLTEDIQPKKKGSP